MALDRKGRSPSGTVVIPAQAGIHFAFAFLGPMSQIKMDPSLRWDDGLGISSSFSQLL
jgi:hypothetical protein